MNLASLKRPVGLWLLEISTLAYLLLPTVIFLATWLRPAVGVPLVVIILAGAFIWIRRIAADRLPADGSAWIASPLTLRDAFLSVIVVTVVTAHLGVGGWGTMSSDTRYRSVTIFRDLVDRPWPVVYSGQDFRDVPVTAIALAGQPDGGTSRGIVHDGSRSGFIAQDPAIDLLGVTEGTRVRLSGSGQHTVTAIEGDRVWLSGSVDAAHDGFPQTVRVDWGEGSRVEPLAMVYSIGWFLPPALAGKWLGWDAANHLLFAWSVIGIWLGACWVMVLSGPAKLTALAILILFGGMDVLGDVVRRSWAGEQLAWPRFDSHIEWWAGFKRFAFESNIANIHWSIQHFIPGVIAAPFAVYQVLYQKRYESLALLVALTFIWSPLVFFGIAPVVLVLLLGAKWRDVISFPNLVAAPLLGFCMLLFYMKPPGTIPHGWVWRIYGERTLVWLALFYMVEFGFYAIAIRPYTRQLRGALRHLWLGVVAGLVIAPLYAFGWSSDISMRMSLPLLVVFVVFLSQAVYWLWSSRRYARLTVLVLLLFVGSWSGLIDARLAIREISYPTLYRTPPVDLGLLEWAYWIPHPSMKSNKAQYLSDGSNPFLRCCLREWPD